MTQRRYNAERIERGQMMTKWLLGHACEVLTDMDPKKVRVQVGDTVFEDDRVSYPSEKLVANLALCIDAAGYSSEAFAVGDFDEEIVHELLDYAVLRLPPRYSLWASDMGDLLIEGPRVVMFDGVRMP